MPLPPDYVERVYAGILGKMIGVYLGRPFEGWTHEKILATLGEVRYYVHEQLGVPLVVTDDDLSGTFTFIRALEDYGYSRDLSPAQIGQTWLNYLIEGKTVLWWGGLGNSTEHTAYLRLKRGIPAPRSGSIELNGKVVAEQIGAQIFIDGWAMVAPGDPALAADLARRAGSVSHDGEAVYAAQVIAAIESAAFVEPDLQKLLDIAVGLIPRDSLLFRLIADLREWREKEPDWGKAREMLAARYGYDTYGGNCHVIPNHGLVLLSLLWGKDDFQETMKIVNTCGWDTDCNAGNVGCIMGIKNGLAGIDAGPDWRGPVADRLYLPTADGGRCITDAVSETFALANTGRAMQGLGPLGPKAGARYHFSLPGSVQGWRADDAPDARGVCTVENTPLPGADDPRHRALALHYRHLAPGRSARALIHTFIPPDASRMPGYAFLASPILYPGYTISANLFAAPENQQPVDVTLFLRCHGDNDALLRISGPTVTISPGQRQSLQWQAPPTAGPIAELNLEMTSAAPTAGSIYLDSLDWTHTPDVVFTFPPGAGDMTRRAWVNACSDVWFGSPGEMVRLMQNEGRGLLMQGTRSWGDYRVETIMTPHLARAAGIAARVQGLRRFYALLLAADNTAAVLKSLDGERVLARRPVPWRPGHPARLAMEVAGNRIHAWLDDELLFDITDNDRPLTQGAIALVCEEGRTAFGPVRVGPAVETR